MVRALLIAGLVILLLLAGLGAMLYMAYGISDHPPAEVGVEGITDSASVVLYRNGSATIRAATREDAFASMGYLHGQEHAWSMALWRRTAEGRLSEWFGSDLLTLDQLARRLRLAAEAEQAYDGLSDDAKQAVDAYARGVNAAFASRRVRMANEFVLLETTPEAWAPWHTLAVERLFGWVAAPRPPADSLRTASDELQSFFEADRLLRRWLHLRGFENGIMWTMQDSSGTRLVQRHVYGATALPIFQTVRLEWPGSPAVTGAALIGTPFMPVGRTDSRAWGILLSSSLDLVRTRRDTSSLPVAFDRIRTGDGTEHLLRQRRADNDLFFPASPRRIAAVEAGADTTLFADTTGGPGEGLSGLNAAAEAEPGSAGSPAVGAPQEAATADTSASLLPGWVVRWSGFSTSSDAEAWLSLLDNGGQPFGMFEGDGMSMSRGGATDVLGSPLVVADVPGGQLIGNSRWSAFAAERLDSLSRPDATVETIDLITDRQSAWAARLAPPLTEAAIAVPEQPHLVTEGLTYLRNWDFAYDRASIAASIFDRWMAVYRDSLGHIPDATLPDTALAENLVRYETLVRTIDMLARDYGDDLSTWRWEVVEPHVYHFPAWSADTLVQGISDLRSNSRYSSIELPGFGHPTTLYFGSSRLTGQLDAPARWEAWISTADWDAFWVRARQFQSNRFFGRYLVSDRIPEPMLMSDSEQQTYSIQLIPE